MTHVIFIWLNDGILFTLSVVLLTVRSHVQYGYTFKEDLVDRGVDWNSVRAVATNRSRWL